MIAKWEDVVNRKHTLESSPDDTEREFLNALHGMIGPQMALELDGRMGVLVVPFTDARFLADPEFVAK